jgi:sulfite exporter TauE/SafE
MNGLSLASVLVASLLGSVHCAAMCGGFVAAYADGAEGGPRRRLGAHVAYNAARLVTYLALGALAGALGRALDLAGNAVGLADAAAIVAGALLLASGLVALAPRSSLVKLRGGPQSSASSLLGRVLVRFRSAPPVVRATLLGLSSALLPCGWLYAFAALAAGTGSALAGALLMATFWLGTVPMLLGLGLSLETLGRRFARLFSRLRPALVIGVGAVTLLSRLQLPAFAAARPGTAPAAAHAPMPADCPCHHR